MSDKKIFLTGGSGFLGWNICHHFINNNIPLYALKHSTPLLNHDLIREVRADLLEQDSIESLIQNLQPDVIVHCAALSGTGQCENNPQLAEKLNVDVTGNLLKAANPDHCRFIYISTDLVFDGSKGWYKESDETNPGMVYARTKVKSENIVRSMSPNYVIARMALMYGLPSPSYSSFLEWMKDGFKEGSLNLFRDEYRTPLYVKDAAKGLYDLCFSDYTGLLHLGGPERCSRYDFGLLFARIAGMPEDAIHGEYLADANTEVYRPPDVSLDSSLATDLIDFIPCGIEEGIADYIKYENATTRER